MSTPTLTLQDISFGLHAHSQDSLVTYHLWKLIRGALVAYVGQDEDLGSSCLPHWRDQPLNVNSYSHSLLSGLHRRQLRVSLGRADRLQKCLPSKSM